MQIFDVIVIGQGFAGLSAARLCAQRGLSTANIEAEMFGGLIINVNELDPAPAGAQSSGVDLASELATANMEADIVQLSGRVSAITRELAGSLLVHADGTSHRARDVILATGARFRELGIEGEAELTGLGVSHCADCDGPLYKGRDTVVVGGGDSAFQEALALAHHAGRVTLLYRGDAPRARADLIARVRANPRITEWPRSTPLAILGEDGVESLRVDREGRELSIDCSGVFIFAGLLPNAECAPAEVLRDAQGALRVDERCATAVPHLWAIGAVRAGFGGTLDDAAADAARVAAAI
jgi:thioredoxin reductase (NADPH)